MDGLLEVSETASVGETDEDVEDGGRFTNISPVTWVAGLAVDVSPPVLPPV